MKKILSLLSVLFLLNGCAESMALLAPASSVAGGGNIVQSSFTSAVSYGVKKQTGKSPSEHVFSYMKENNPDKKKEKCVSFLESTNSEVCAVIKKQILEAKKNIKEKSSIKFLNTN
tara:strand:+ start:1078 stop:1425 length:348 start_codon:yes stop_codon:yes gene_type:complete